MWEAGGVIDHGGGGHHEALLLQAAAHGGGEVHGHGPGLLPWLQGPAAAATAGPPYMSVVVPPRHLTQAAPPPFGADHQAGEDETFAVAGGGYYCVEGDGGGVGHHHQYGMFGLEPPPAPATTSSSLHHMGRGSRVLVSGLLGTLQAELGRMTAKEIMDAKALAASRSHSEAERRRRQRINGHLARLRSLLPNTTKTDKASLLAEVIDHVKELKRQTSAMMAAGEAAPAPEQLLLPTEADELAVEAGADEEGRLVARASLCCEDRADLIPDIARALAALRLRARRAEIATLGGRVRSVLLIAAVEEEADDNRSDDGDGDRDGGEDNGCDDDGCGRVVAASHRRHELVASIQEALRGVIDRKAASSDTSSSGGGGGGGGSGSTKRQRMNGAHDQGSFYLAGNSS